MKTRYGMDLNPGLTQVLADGTNTYLYGMGRIAQQDGDGIQYFLGDALGSVRQLVDHTCAITLAKAYEPYVNTISSAGEALTSYDFTGDGTDSCIFILYNSCT